MLKILGLVAVAYVLCKYKRARALFGAAVAYLKSKLG